MFIYKYQQLSNRISYSEMTKTNCNISKKIHLGQLKLLISEIMFLSKIAKKGNKVLYIGAAEGFHITKLSDMFPDLSFDLWDPRKFDLELRSNIKLFNKFFTDNDALQYIKEKDNLLLITDIRNIEIGKIDNTTQKGNDKIDKFIIDDNNRQLNWIKTINPIYSFIKFRLPYGKGKTKYFNGKIYLQCYSGLTTETRLMTNKYDSFEEYDHTEFDEKLAYFNCFIRSKNDFDKWKQVFDKYKIKNNWDNNCAFYILHLYLDKVKNYKNIKDDDVAILFNNIIAFFNKKYGTKYNYVYVK
ncbi:mRNA cap-specific nucleoside 2-O-methyltransferase [Fadolivirus algeromassiliense]|jgi:hypothetical protein|uniref:Cap-specific mRNA (nucleoside-2'-O-)-methyltransferase n=1 Tax=Fadolivirus FV1/VV64 TaxID=3070911 RepID=A0A7D3UQ81_9VIRU|nr:mRNA cap-specific nucleoside 2-O-methyltransferase [Fadolivirus algeromassiliense]QKF93553.1 mRNA cap-specific nucleoside 2-O-methyltransferase [Fadolivirus FV1/VV64]